MAHRVKHPLAIQETWVRSLGRKDPLEKEMAWKEFAWKIPWTEKPGRLQSLESQRAGHDGATSLVGLRPQAFNKKLSVKRASLVAQLVKNPL